MTQKQRIEELERKVAELEERLAANPQTTFHYVYPYWSVTPPAHPLPTFPWQWQTTYSGFDTTTGGI